MRAGSHDDYSSEYWDWNGHGWMMSENPIFLIDIETARWGGGSEMCESVRPMPERRCYFIPDAHHSIPFRLQRAGQGGWAYVAEPWFDAALNHDGELDTNTGGWLELPTRFDVYLNRQNIRYSFEPHYEDVLPADHAPPSHGGCGDPYYGILKEITDRQGNRAVIEHCGNWKFDYDGCRVPAEREQNWQTCKQAGQIKTIKLYAPASPNPSYTIVYYHQPGGCASERDDYCPSLTLAPDRYLRSLFVYEGDVSSVDNLDCLTLPQQPFCSTTAFSSLQDLDNIVYEHAPDDWILQIEYTYSRGAAFLPEDVVGYCRGGGNSSVLIRTIVRRRSVPDASEQPTERATLYRYPTTVVDGHCPSLRSIYLPETVDAIVAALREYNDEADVNDLLNLSDDYLVSLWLEELGTNGTKSLGNLATYSFDYWTEGELFDLNQSTWFNELAVRYANGAFPETYSAVPVGVKSFHARTGSPGVDGSYVFYYLRNAVPLPGGGITCWQDTDWIAHVPFYAGIGYEYPIPPADKARYVTVVDHSAASRPLERRVVEINPLGFILRDRTFEYDGDLETLKSQAGYDEQRIYDGNGLVREVRTAAWGSEANTNSLATDGLIFTFDYDDVNNDGKPDELELTSLKLGTDGDKYCLAHYDHDYPGRPDLVSRTVLFNSPVTTTGLAPALSGDLANHEVTLSNFELGTPTSGFTSPPIASEAHYTKVGTPRKGSGPIWSVERMLYDTSGQLIWRGFGETLDPTDGTGASITSFFVDRFVYNESNRIERAAIDTNGLAQSNGFVRVADPDLPELNIRTHYTYDSQGRPTRIDKPGNRSDWYLYDVPTTDAGTNGPTETWKYEDVVLTEGDFLIEKPVTIIEQSALGRLEAILQVRLTATYDEPSADEPYEVVSRTKMNYDEFGRPVGVQALPEADSDTNGIASFINYDAFGQVGREQSPDGTITRTVRTMRGRVQRIYRGTNDIEAFWGTGIIDQYPDGFPDNMVLVEKRYYGDGTVQSGGAYSTGQLVESRRYNQKPINQYDYDGEGIPENDEDSTGLPTVYEYDCRNRLVFAEDRDIGELPLRRSFTWYDHQDRVRFSAEYGPNGGPPAGLDPRDACYWRTGQPYPGSLPATPDLPRAVNLLDGATQLLGLTETRYNQAGQVTEERTYDVSSGAAAEYTATYYDFNGRGLTVEQQSPGGGVVKSLYDALGRLVRQQTFAADAELYRTLKTYDELGNLLADTTFERPAGAAGALLDSCTPAAVERYRHYWYDIGSRLIATADYGTNDTTNDNFAPGSPPSYDPQYIPDFPEALVTHYEYDAAGRQNYVTDAAGITTFTEYDDLGRVLLVTENVDGIEGDPRHTAYKYEKRTGRLTHVAAVRADYLDTACGDPPHCYSAINWEPTDGSAQVTRYVYNAEVVNLDTNGVDYGAVSTNGAWISAVHYPDPDTGAPADEPTVQFTYRHDGQVIERTDARGVRLIYAYDGRDRLKSIFADWTEAGPQLQYRYKLDTIAASMHYTYTADGLLASAEMRDPEGVMLNRIGLTYGGFRQVESVTQTLAGQTPRVVTYDWERDSSSNGHRLVSMQYPHDTGPTVRMFYGADGSIDDRLDRLTDITNAGAVAQAYYRHMGVHRLVGQGAGLHQVNYDDGAGGAVTGLDRFGRVTEINHVLAGTAQSDLRYEYGYDAAGNRTFARVENPATAPDDRSWLYGYDGLSRLTHASEGELDEAGDAFATGEIPETLLWELDDLGNWSADPAGQASYHRFTDTDADGEFGGSDVSLQKAHHDTNQINEIDRLITQTPTDADTVGFYYDPVGNLRLDGERYYVYDPWNRLAAIYKRGTLGVYSTGNWHGTPDICTVRFRYDALGRKVLTETWPETPSAATTEHVYGTGPAALEEYDVASNGTATLARWFIHGESFPDPLVMVDLTDAGDLPAGQAEWLYYLKDALGSVGALANAAGEIVERYVYDPYGETYVLTPDGAPAVYLTEQEPGWRHDCNDDGWIRPIDCDFFDTCLNDTPTSPLCVYVHDRDENRFIDAADEAIFGAATNCPSSTPARESFARPRTSRFDVDDDDHIDLYDFYGLQYCFATTNAIEQDLCLAIYDLDGDELITLADLAYFTDSATGPDAAANPQPLTHSRYGNPFAWTGQRYDVVNDMYHFWARSYSPVTGRFAEFDKMGALASVTVALHHAGDPIVSIVHTSAEREYYDSLNLLLYALANPSNRIDRLGLFFDEYDDATDDLTGTKLYALGILNEGAHWASIGLKTTLGIAGSLLPGAGLYDAFTAVNVIADGKGGFWEAVAIASAAMPIAKLGMTAFRSLRTLNKAKKFGRLHCNCFVAQTSVVTPQGLVPIERLHVGDAVCTRNQFHEFSRQGAEVCTGEIVQDLPDAERPEPLRCAHVGHVTRRFRSVAKEILWITLVNESVLGITPGHPVWTHQVGWTAAHKVCIGDTLADEGGNPIEVIDIEVDPSPAVVYNIEVDGTYTYFAEGVWVHNTSACRMLVAAGKHKHHLFPDQFRSFFARRGIDIDDYVMEIDEMSHLRGVHGRGTFVGQSGKPFPKERWNDEWSDYITNNQNASPKEVYQYLGTLMDKYGLSSEYIPG